MKERYSNFLALKERYSNFVAFLWFFCVLFWALLLFPLVLISYPRDICIILNSGYGIGTTGTAFLLLSCLIFGITMITKPLRKFFYKLPWLYPYIVILTLDSAIFSIGIELLNYGYQVQNSLRHTKFFVFMIIQLVVCRIIMCVFCYKKSMRIES